MYLFVNHPGYFWAGSYLFGALSLLAFLWKRRFPQIRWLPMLITCLMWLVFSFFERDNVVHYVDIRVDAIFIWPFFFAITAILFALFILGLIRAARAAKRTK
jgi:hypothetical protein